MVAFGELAVIFCVGVVDTIPWRMEAVFDGELYRDPYFTGHYLSLIVDEQHALTRC